MIRTLLVFLVLCGTAQAAKPTGQFYFEEYFPAAPVVPVEAKRSPAAFHAWADQFNARQLSDAEARYEQQLAMGQFQGTDGVLSSSHTKTATRHTGVGMGGYGGPGGYTGRGDLVPSMGLSGYGNLGLPSYGNLGLPSYGNYAIGGPSPNSESLTSSGGSSYAVHWKDPNDNGGGPVLIINPFCWEYWSKQ